MSDRHRSLSLSAARRLALSAQGFGADHTKARRITETGGEAADEFRPDRRALRRAATRLKVIQIDSVNVVSRAHYLPLYSRLGPYDRALLDRDAFGPPSARRYFEYWGHECSLMPLEFYPLFEWRRRDAERGVGIYGQLARFQTEQRGLIQSVLRRIERDGPMPASALADIKPALDSLNATTDNPTSSAARAPTPSDGWWGWNDTKQALEALFWSGHLTTATRHEAGFTRIYDLPERALPKVATASKPPPRAEAQRELIRHAAEALGIATRDDLRTYWRIPAADIDARIAELVDAGMLEVVTVRGWDRTAYIAARPTIPRRIEARALLAPFDPLVWERPRAERLFDFHYRIEIYTPAEKRVFGYYVLPFLLGERLVARLCLKADRAAGTLLARKVTLEADDADAPPLRDTAPGPLASELNELALWLGLEKVQIAEGPTRDREDSQHLIGDLRSHSVR